MTQYGYDEQQSIALAEVLDRVLNKGAVITGEVTISVADVDLIYLSLRVLVSSVDSALRLAEPKQDTGP